MKDNKNKSVEEVKVTEDQSIEKVVEELKIVDGLLTPMETEVQTEVQTEPWEVQVGLEEETTKLLTGVVVNCARLQVWDKQEQGAISSVKLNFEDNVLIDESASNSRWFKIRTNTGIEGFCHTKFIRIK